MIVKFTGSTLSFADVPSAGDGFERNGQRYMFVEAKPYVRKTDGKTSTLLTWQSHCADCDQPFTVTTGLDGIRPQNTRCSEHTSPLKPATKSAAAALTAARKRFTRKSK